MGQGDLILSKREYEGKDYHNLEVTLDKIELTGGKSESQAAPAAKVDDLDDSIPF